MVVLDSLRQGRRDWAQIDFAFPHHKGLKAHAVLEVPEVRLKWRLAQSQQFYITSKLTLKAHGVGAFNYQETRHSRRSKEKKGRNGERKRRGSSSMVCQPEAG